MSAPDAFAPLTVDRHLGGRYRLIGPIARGGMAEVWEGYDEILARPVAIKVLLSHLATDQIVKERFRREAITAARLAHPNVVATFDTGADGGTAYIVMELVRGDTLRQLLADDGAQPIPVAAAIADQIADALGYAHRSGLIHRDVKPANVLLADDEGLLPRIKVTDFGIAKAAEKVGADLTSTGILLGTPKYLSPEQVEGREPDARADLYSLGVVLFEMLTGRPPFTGPTEMATALAHLRDRAPAASSLRGGIPPALDRAVATLLAKEPAERFQTAAELRSALAPFVPGADGTWGHTARLGPAPRPQPDRTRVSLPPAGVAGPVGYAPGGTAENRVGPPPGWSPAAAPRRAGPPAPGPFTPAPDGRRAEPRRPHRRRAPAVVVASVVIAGAIVAALLLSRNSPTPASSAGGGSGAASGGSAVQIARAQVFVLAGHTPDDPQGAANTLDGNPSTVWHTDVYNNAHFGNLYPGIGLAFHLSSASTLSRMVVTAPGGGWSAETYVADRLPAESKGVAGWGSPTDTKTASGTRTVFSLGGRRGSWVLLWLTSTGGPPYSAAIGDVSVYS